ncbi:MAG: flagellar brake protein [Cycloclasticus sp.]|nr:flagellar brake protein [Cycloclasticus sp.]
MSLLSNLKSMLVSEQEKHDATNDNPNFIVRPSRIKHMLQTLMDSHVQISVVLKDESEYTSRILNVTKDDMTLDQFNSREAHNKMATGITIHVNAKHNAVSFNFSTNIIGSSRDGGYLISMPDKIYHPQKRAFFRVPMVNIEKYKFLGGVQYSENTVSGYVYDVSFGGICIAVYSNAYLKKGTILSPASLTLKNGASIHADLTVCSVKKAPQEGFTRVGCEFLEISAAEKRNLHKFITECERKRAKK